MTGCDIMVSNNANISNINMTTMNNIYMYIYYFALPICRRQCNLICRIAVNIIIII